MPTPTQSKTIVRAIQAAWRVPERHAPRLGIRWATGLRADPRPVLDAFTRRVGFGPRIRAGVQRAVERRGRLPWEAFDVPGADRVVAVTPTLVVHDRGGRETGFPDGREIAEVWPGAHLLETDGLGHRRVPRDDAVVAAVVDLVAAAASSPAASRATTAPGRTA